MTITIGRGNARVWFELSGDPHKRSTLFIAHVIKSRLGLIQDG